MAVGEVVKVTNGEHLPADLISLSSRLELISCTGNVYVGPHIPNMKNTAMLILALLFSFLQHNPHIYKIRRGWVDKNTDH